MLNTNSIHTQKGKLQDVILIRFIVVVLLLLCHSFAIYSGSWQPLKGHEAIPAYFWIGRGIPSAMLQTFVFISGYILGLQIAKNKFNYSITFLYKKFKRLIIPSVIFSAIWALLYNPPTKDTFVSILQNIGIAHLWFLPMLFWCFVSTGILKYVKVNQLVLLVFMFAIFFHFFYLPFRLNSFFQYAFYFYLGIYIYNNKNLILSRYCNWKTIIPLCIIYLSIFVLSTLFINDNYIYNSKVLTIGRIGSRIVYSTLGVLFIYLLANKIILKIKEVPTWVSYIATLSFAIYIFHQFILKALYYYTPLPEMVNPYLLPWLGFTITAILSVAISALALKTTLGRKLLG